MKRSKRFKVILIGDPSVGKTTLRNRYMGKNFDAEYVSTLGVDLASKEIEHNFINYKLQIWDIAGQNEYPNIHNKYFQNSMGILLVFDLTNITSFNNLTNWISKYLFINYNKMRPLVIIGNKSDLIDSSHQIIDGKQIKKQINVIRSEIAKTSKAVGIKYIETSAKLNIAVEDAFVKLIEMMIE